MKTLPPILKKISLFLQRLPGIGEKTANRLALFLWKLPKDDLDELANNLHSLKKEVILCQNCGNLTQEIICPICLDQDRNPFQIMVVETVLDLMVIESADVYQGHYHVLHGRIDPLNRVGPEDLTINLLIKRLKNIARNEEVETEVILATNTDLEGESTANYIKKLILQVGLQENLNLVISRLALGLPIGASLEYADYGTITKAFENRSKVSQEKDDPLQLLKKKN